MNRILNLLTGYINGVSLSTICLHIIILFRPGCDNKIADYEDFILNNWKENYVLKFSHNKTRKRTWKIVLCTLGPNIGNPSKDHNNMNVFAKMIKLCKSVVGGSSTFTAFSRTVFKYTPLQKQFAVFVYNDKINISFSAEFK